MSVEVDPGYIPPSTQPLQPAKRFFRCEELPWGDPSYTVVARDLEHAKQILRESKCEFGDPSKPYDEAEAAHGFEWEEMLLDRVAKINVDFCGDRGLGSVPLLECELGDWFSSEY